MMITISVLSKMTIYIFLLVFFVQRQIVAFQLFSSKSRTHQDITRTAILETTAKICKMKALRKGMDFVLPNILTEESLARACSSSDSAKGFKRSIKKIKGSNAWVDFYHVLNPIYHFDDESFLFARELITKGVITVKASVKQQNYEIARQKLGEVLHTLQDFYSHSNWIELGNKGPYSNLIKPSSQIDNLAGNMPTCRSCNGNDCTGNILKETIAQQKLTSGYFNFFRSFKPEGKCSHGGFLDQTSRREPKGGINKDAIDSSHGFLHLQAAEVATAATRELLEDIRAATGDSEFLRLMGFSQTSVLCFVIDTTGSMSDDIAEVRRVISYFINSKMGTATQPSEYILVPFNDPDYGPLTRTTDPDVFKKKIDALTAAGGDDGPEMCLSGLQLALTGSPPQTEIFVFTDAEAKDRELMSSVRALIETTKSVVTFMLTNALGARRRRDNGRLINSQQQIDSRLSNPSNQDYQNLAEASGGQAIEVTKATLHQATSIIVDSSNSSLVTLFQAVRNPAKAENFSVFVDSSLKKLMIYITCSSPYYIITSPSGVSQTSVEPSGALGFIQMAGNIHIVHPNISDQAGLWLINITSTKPYSIKVFGQSDVDFLFDFVDISQDNLSYAVLNSRPKANSNATLLVTMVGGDNVSLTGVALVETSSSNFVNGTLEEVTSGQYLVTISSIPAEEFIVRVSGEISSSRATGESFQRQFSTRLQASSVTIIAQADGTLEPGKTFTLPFKVASNNYGGNVTIRVSNDRGLETVFPSSLTLVSGGEANGTISLVAPGNAPSGSDVTMTIEAETHRGSDSNYAVLRFAVVSPVTDVTPPVCEIVSMHANCSGNCSLFTWDFSVNITDGNGSGIQSVRDLQGKGTLNTSSILGDGGKNITLAFYTASCCFQEVDLVVIDEVGNVGTCFRSTLNSGAPSGQNGFFGAECSLVQQVCFWLNVGAILLYQIMPL